LRTATVTRGTAFAASAAKLSHLIAHEVAELAAFVVAELAVAVAVEDRLDHVANRLAVGVLRICGVA
jgi:hypothetical protein